MGILYLLIRFLLRPAFFLRKVFLSVSFPDVACRRLCRLVGDTGGICTQIRDDTNGSLPFNINSFLDLLCQTHGSEDKKIQYL